MVQNVVVRSVRWLFKGCVGGWEEQVSAVNAYGQLTSHWVGRGGSQSLHRGLKCDQAAPGTRTQRHHRRVFSKQNKTEYMGNSYKEVTLVYRYVEILARHPFSLLLFGQMQSVLFLIQVCSSVILQRHLLCELALLSCRSLEFLNSVVLSVEMTLCVNGCVTPASRASASL